MYFVEKTKGLNFFKHFDYLLFIAVLILSVIGILVVKSATLTNADGGRMMVMKQLIGMSLGIVMAIVLSYIDYKDFKVLGFALYIISIGLLVYVLAFGTGDSLGSRSWISIKGISYQPSELAKVAFVMVASIFLERISEGQRKGNIVKLAVYSSIIIGLVVAQKDFGTSAVFMFMFFVMLYICKLPYKLIFGMIGAVLAALPFFWFFVFNDARKSRIISFIYPELDPLGSGYNVLRSKYAIGSGQITGKGLFEGVQTQNSVVPVKESDFIFSVVGEELGFVGACAVVLLIFFILLRCIYIAKNSRDLYGSFLVTGVTSMLAFHAFENIGMSIGLMPVTGIPLPFVSAGGTAVTTYYMAIGVVLSVSLRRKRVLFNNSQ
jgi:rod shape determining protein RodA